MISRKSLIPDSSIPWPMQKRQVIWVISRKIFILDWFMPWPSFRSFKCPRKNNILREISDFAVIISFLDLVQAKDHSNVQGKNIFYVKSLMLFKYCGNLRIFHQSDFAGEINFSDSESSKTVILWIFGNFSLSKLL